MVYKVYLCGAGEAYLEAEHRKRGCHWYHDGTGPPCTCDLPVRSKMTPEVEARRNARG